MACRRCDLSRKGIATSGAGASKGIPSAMASSNSAVPTMDGTIYAGLSPMMILMRLMAWGEMRSFSARLMFAGNESRFSGARIRQRDTVDSTPTRFSILDQ